MRQTLFTIAPHAPFLPTLVDKVLDGTLLPDWDRSGPFWLADITVVLPTRRARLALADAFSRRGVGLLPDIRSFGGEMTDEEPFLPHLEQEPLAPAMGGVERHLTLAELVEKWAMSAEGRQTLSTPPNAAEILALAESLATLIDDLHVEGIGAEAIRAIPPESLSANWQQTLRFLEIALAAWPQILQGSGCLDGVALRNQRLQRQAESAAQIFGDRPVIAAGSTGSIPATAALMRALARLPRGVIVLPGLDTTLTPEDHTRLTTADRSPHGHPQYGLAQLLLRLRGRPDSVTELAPNEGSARTRLLRRALALADATSVWADEREDMAPDLDGALRAVEVLAAANEDAEARAIALAARDGLAGGKRVGIISPDRNLARRIAAELARFDVFVDDAAGAPLFQSAAGRLVRHIMAVVENDFAAVDLMALLRNRATQLGRERLDVARLADLLELGLLRGQRPGKGLAGLRRQLLRNLEKGEGRVVRRLSRSEGGELDKLFGDLETALAPLSAVVALPSTDAPAMAAALGACFERITATAPRGPANTVPGQVELRRWVAETSAKPGIGPQLPQGTMGLTLSALMSGFSVRNLQPRRDDIAIWGELEARLQNPDLTILAGLNEDIWPSAADPGPWLSRGMRMAAGLEPPERRHGQQAHDFTMAVGNQAVILAFAERIGGSPAIPSRYLQRLEGFVGRDWTNELRARGKRWCDMARQIDDAGVVRPAARPRPRPIAKLRPRKLSITEVEQLLRSPYDIYAKHVLRLRRLTPLGEEPSAAERGSLVHAVFRQFVDEGHDVADPAALETLKDIARNVFAELEGLEQRRDIWLRRFGVAAERYLEWERSRDSEIASRHAEVPGKMSFPHLKGFVLHGRADRIDRRLDGGVEIVDFKTGRLPELKEMQGYLAPQLLLEAALARKGHFEKLKPAEPSGLAFLKISLKPDAFTPTKFRTAGDCAIAEATDEVLRRLERHVGELLLADALPMSARPRPPKQRFAGEYDHLARSDEWMVAEGDDSE